MHDSQRIRYGVTDRLLAQAGSLVPGGIHTGRARGILADGIVPAILVDNFRETSDVFDEENGAEAVTYIGDVLLVGNGPEPDLADGVTSCMDELDDLTLVVRRALKRAWGLSDEGRIALGGGDGGRVLGFRYVDRAVEMQPGGRGTLAHVTLRYAITVVCEDGDPSFAD